MQTTFNFADPTTARQALFLSTDGQPFTTSRAIAEKFNKKHYNVIKSIKKILLDSPDPDFDRVNFNAVNYRDRKGEERLEYQISHDGFAILVMGFTGSEAQAWKYAFLRAFKQIEKELEETQQKYIAALDQVRPSLRPVVEFTQQGEGRAQIGFRLGKSVNAVTYHRRRARELGLLPKVQTALPVTH